MRTKSKPKPPTIHEIGRGINIPTLPDAFRKKLWNIVKVNTSIKLSEETEHFMNILCLHFGLSRNDLFLHAINLLWHEVADTVGAERLKDYEEKLESVRIYRLEQREIRQDHAKKESRIRALSNNRKASRGGEVGTIWRFKTKRAVRVDPEE